MNEVVLFLIIILFSPSIPSSAEAELVDGLTVADLIHRDSPLSPFYNSSLTQTELLQNAVMRSISRNKRFHHFSEDQGSKAESVLIPNNADYLMKIFIGSPPKEQLVIVDPGSDVSWVQCLPCLNCYKQTAPIFNPRQSSTYETISCLSPYCAWIGIDRRSCGRSNECRYIAHYGDNSTTWGDLARDTIRLSSNGSVYPPKILFGCGHRNTGEFQSTGTGLVGLGRGYLSLVSQLRFQLGHIFSYCLLNPFATTNSKIKFGKISTMPRYASTTPFAYKPPSAAYFLTLDYVSVNGDGKLKVVRPLRGSLDIEIDIGTTVTYLDQPLYDSVESAVANSIEREALRQPPKPFSLCYEKGIIGRYPNITFHFRGADVHLHQENAFMEYGYGRAICLAMLPSKVSTFGNRAQVNYKVEFNLLRRTVSFARAYCSRE